jgi:hypothetical protein
VQPNPRQPDPTTIAAIQARLSSLQAGPVTDIGHLNVVALLGPDHGPTPALGTDALLTGNLVVEELDHGGSVPELRARNRSDKAVLMLLGDELLGGKQHRVVNTHILVAGGQELIIPVSCIEAGRWGRASRTRSRTRPRRGRPTEQSVEDLGDLENFVEPPKGAFLCRRRPLSVHSDLRASLARQTRTSLSAGRRARSDQRAVWREVERYSSTRGVASPTLALSEALDDQDSEKINIEPVDGQVGFAAWAGDELVGLELFGSSSVLKGSFRRLVTSASLGRHRASKVDEAALGEKTGVVLAALSDAPWEQHDGVGQGVEARAALGDAEVVSLIDGNSAVTLSVLAV